MTVEFHADAGRGGRAVGRPRTGLLSSRDPVTVAKAAKQLIQSGHWQQQAGRDDRTKVLISLQSRLPFAVGQLPVDALVALTKQPPPGGCHWCAALLQVVPDRPELDRTPVTLALLGEGCQRCRHRWQVDERVVDLVDEAREQARQAAGRPRPPEPLVAATPPPPASATRPPEVPPRSFQPSPWPPPVQPTRIPDPRYYTRRPWPPEDTG
jgi:hypothetical protein